LSHLSNLIDILRLNVDTLASQIRESDEHAAYRKEAWRALEDLHVQGKCKAIGVSNYTIAHLEQMKSYWRTKPAVNQVECHPCLVQDALRNWCKSNDILVEAYSSLGQGELLRNEEVVKIAETHKKTPAQILLRWGLQQNLAIIPKSISASRIKENSGLFDFSLGDSEVQSLNLLDRNYHVCWDPTGVK